ncbi:hypothetical protein [Granulicella paludicola]|uniref:hypothetical protein n=1 Tax=Granulicella paludicola TaxID=474951 RepID=UPI0021E022CA|nr:hypothetical protein [Granulicella paludicola]
MFKLRFMQAFSLLLLFCLISGTYLGLRDRAYIPTAIGMCVNVMWLYGAQAAIRKRKQSLTNSDADSNMVVEPVAVRLEPREVKKAMLPVLAIFVAVLLVDVTLFVSNRVPPQIFAWLVVGEAALTTIVLTWRLNKAHKLKG